MRVQGLSSGHLEFGRIQIDIHLCSSLCEAFRAETMRNQLVRIRRRSELSPPAQRSFRATAAVAFHQDRCFLFVVHAALSLSALHRVVQCHEHLAVTMPWTRDRALIGSNEALAKPPSSVLQAQYSEARIQYSELEPSHGQRVQLF